MVKKISEIDNKRLRYRKHSWSATMESIERCINNPDGGTFYAEDSSNDIHKITIDPKYLGSWDIEINGYNCGIVTNMGEAWDMIDACIGDLL